MHYYVTNNQIIQTVTDRSSAERHLTPISLLLVLRSLRLSSPTHSSPPTRFLLIFLHCHRNFVGRNGPLEERKKKRDAYLFPGAYTQGTQISRPEGGYARIIIIVPAYLESRERRRSNESAERVAAARIVETRKGPRRLRERNWGSAASTCRIEALTSYGHRGRDTRIDRRELIYLFFCL